jgi:hypothetical protein
MVCVFAGGFALPAFGRRQGIKTRLLDSETGESPFVDNNDQTTSTLGGRGTRDGQNYSAKALTKGLVVTEAHLQNEPSKLESRPVCPPSTAQQIGNSECPSFAILTIARDQIRTMPDWLQYHGRLVGFENIHVINNMGSHPVMNGIYEKLQRIYGMGYSHMTAGFGSKHVHLTDIARRMRCKYDFLMFLDSDEFLTFWDLKEHSVSKERICKELRRYKELTNYNRFKFTNCGCKCYDFHETPSTHGRMAQCPHMHCGKNGRNEWGLISKTFHRASQFVATDQGNHFGCVVDQPCYKVKGNKRAQ